MECIRTWVLSIAPSVLLEMHMAPSHHAACFTAVVILVVECICSSFVEMDEKCIES